MQPSLSPPAYKRLDARGELVEVIADGRWEAVLLGKMRADAVMGQHYHKMTRVYFFLTTGQAEIALVDIATNKRTSFGIQEGHGTYLEPGQAHAIRFTKPSEFVMTKSHRHDPANPDTFPFPIEFEKATANQPCCVAPTSSG